MKKVKLNELPTQDYLKSVLNYYPEIGEVWWKDRPRESFKSNELYSYFINNTLTKPAGTNKSGYLVIWVDGKLYRLHRIIWKLYYGEEPKHFIDHINGNRSDNRIENLREANNGENMRNVVKLLRNNTSGYRGILSNNRGRWKAKLDYNSVTINIGTFDTLDEARTRRVMLEKALYKEFYVQTDDIEDTDYYKDYINNLTEEQFLEYTTFKKPKKQKTVAGYTGVGILRSGRYSSRVRYDKVTYYIGTYDTPEEAALARENKLKELKSLDTNNT